MLEELHFDQSLPIGGQHVSRCHKEDHTLSLIDKLPLTQRAKKTGSVETIVYETATINNFQNLALFSRHFVF